MGYEKENDSQAYSEISREIWIANLIKNIQIIVGETDYFTKKEIIELLSEWIRIIQKAISDLQLIEEIAGNSFLKPTQRK